MRVMVTGATGFVVFRVTIALLTTDTRCTDWAVTPRR